MIKSIRDNIMLVGFPVRQFQLCKTNQGAASIGSETISTVIPATKKVVQMVEKTLPNGKIVKMKQEVEVPVEPTEQPVANLSDDCLWVDENAVEQYTQRGYGFTGKKRMSYCPPEWIADKEKGGILLLDDYTRK